MIAELINYDSLKIAKELEISDEDIKNLSEILSTGSNSFIFGTDMIENQFVSDYISSITPDMSAPRSVSYTHLTLPTKRIV